MLNWRALSLRMKITGTVLLFLSILGFIAVTIASQREAHLGMASRIYTVMSLLGMAGVMLSALLDPRSFRARPFHFVPGERTPRVCKVLGAVGFILLMAGTILSKTA